MFLGGVLWFWVLFGVGGGWGGGYVLGGVFCFWGGGWGGWFFGFFFSWGGGGVGGGGLAWGGALIFYVSSNAWQYALLSQAASGTHPLRFVLHDSLLYSLLVTTLFYALDSKQALPLWRAMAFTSSWIFYVHPFSFPAMETFCPFPCSSVICGELSYL